MVFLPCYRSMVLRELQRQLIGGGLKDHPSEEALVSVHETLGSQEMGKPPALSCLLASLLPLGF